MTGRPENLLWKFWKKAWNIPEKNFFFCFKRLDLLSGMSGAFSCSGLSFAVALRLLGCNRGAVYSSFCCSSYSLTVVCTTA